ncbi:hypothetical protein SDC9_122947 [bioreactor metagenome]|uniref:Uncharacterized protein n=1 Tax=bioreactor metagenome TaxID=1076179 RepID=A0A645CGG8_9ZZZZ
MHLMRHADRVERPVMTLAAGHGHGVVVKQLEGDIGLRSDGRAHGQQARMEIRAVTHVLEHVGPPGERRLAHPCHAFRAHLRIAQRVAPHGLRHPRTANACIGAAAVRNARGGVMRAARAEVKTA